MQQAAVVTSRKSESSEKAPSSAASSSVHVDEAQLYTDHYPERNLKSSKKFTEITSFRASTQLNDKAQSNFTNSLYQSKCLFYIYSFQWLLDCMLLVVQLVCQDRYTWVLKCIRKEVLKIPG